MTGSSFGNFKILNGTAGPASARAIVFGAGKEAGHCE